MRRSARLHESATLQSTINVTPLVDVCLVLLIIFMVVTPLLREPVPLPIAENAAPKPEESSQLFVTVTLDGTTSVGAAIVRLDQVVAAVGAAYKANPAREVLVRADRRLPFGDVQRVLAACRQAGFRDVGILTAPRTRNGVSGR